MSTIDLASLNIGQKAVIKSLSLEKTQPVLAKRFMQMGITPGVQVEIAHFAPLGGSLAIRVRGTLIALRIQDARFIEVNL
jgi:Fe2+ transport system protein FeoA